MPPADNNRKILLQPKHRDSDYIEVVAEGVLYTGNRPGRWKYLRGITPEEHVVQWTREVRLMGIRTVVVVLTVEEIDKFYRGGLLMNYRRGGLEVIHLPVPSRGAPRDAGVFMGMLKPVAERLDKLIGEVRGRGIGHPRREAVLVHSSSGEGRVSLVLKALEYLGVKPENRPRRKAGGKPSAKGKLPAETLSEAQEQFAVELKKVLPPRRLRAADTALFRLRQTICDYLRYRLPEAVKNAVRPAGAGEVRVTLAYNMGVLFRDTERLLAVDLSLPSQYVRSPGRIAEYLRGVNVAVFTHYHPDHMNELAIKVLLKAGCPVFALPENPVDGQARLLDWGVPKERIILIQDEEPFSAGGFRFHPHAGEHLNKQIPQMPIVEWSQGGVRFLHTGDHRDFSMPPLSLRGRPDLVIAAVPQQPGQEKAEAAGQWFGALKAKRLWLAHLYEISRLPRKTLTLGDAAEMLERFWLWNPSMQSVPAQPGRSIILRRE